jgi:hypothetical protein
MLARLESLLRSTTSEEAQAGHVMDEETHSADGLVRQIETLQGALHNLQSKYDRLHEANERITAHCSALAEENSNLRGHHQLDDDSSLRNKFQELDFAIRSWCIGLRDTKQNLETPFTLPVPSQDPNIIYQFKTEAAELNFLISGVWEWLVMLVFDPKPLRDEDDDWVRKDLWTSENNSIALRHFERQFRKLKQGTAHRFANDLIADIRRSQSYNGMAKSYRATSRTITR